MSQLTNPFAFTVLGNPLVGDPLPQLRAEGGPLSQDQLGMARDVYKRFADSLRASQLSFQTQRGELPDGSTYRIMVMPGQKIMQVWTDSAGGGAAEDDVVIPPRKPDGSCPMPPNPLGLVPEYPYKASLATYIYTDERLLFDTRIERPGKSDILHSKVQYTATAFVDRVEVAADVGTVETKIYDAMYYPQLYVKYDKVPVPLEVSGEVGHLAVLQEIEEYKAGHFVVHIGKSYVENLEIAYDGFLLGLYSPTIELPADRTDTNTGVRLMYRHHDGTPPGAVYAEALAAQYTEERRVAAASNPEYLALVARRNAHAAEFDRLAEAASGYNDDKVYCPVQYMRDLAKYIITREQLEKDLATWWLYVSAVAASL